MKNVIIIYALALFLLAVITPVKAQQPWPKTIKLYNNANKETIGTVTTWNNVYYLRDNKGKLIAQLIIKNGVKTFLDERGKEINLPSMSNIQLPESE